MGGERESRIFIMESLEGCFVDNFYLLGEEGEREYYGSFSWGGVIIRRELLWEGFGVCVGGWK